MNGFFSMKKAGGGGKEGGKKEKKTKEQQLTHINRRPWLFFCILVATANYFLTPPCPSHYLFPSFILLFSFFFPPFLSLQLYPEESALIILRIFIG